MSERILLHYIFLSFFLSVLDSIAPHTVAMLRVAQLLTCCVHNKFSDTNEREMCMIIIAI